MKAPRTSDRDQRLATIKKQQQSAERRRRLLTYGISAAVIIALIAAIAIVVGGEAQRKAAIEEAAKRPIENVQTFEDLSQNHTEDEVDYPQDPGVGGDHSPIWTNCGVYTAPVKEGQAIHSLEHGAVWISYRPDLPADQIQALTDLVGSQQFVLLSPKPDQKSPIAASAWGKQLLLDSASDERLPAFIKAYKQGPDTPEPGAPCTGGVDG